MPLNLMFEDPGGPSKVWRTSTIKGSGMRRRCSTRWNLSLKSATQQNPKHQVLGREALPRASLPSGAGRRAPHPSSSSVQLGTHTPHGSCSPLPSRQGLGFLHGVQRLVNSSRKRIRNHGMVLIVDSDPVRF